MKKVKNSKGEDITDNQVIDALPGRFQNPLKKPRLEKLTFGDLEIAGTQLEKFKKQSKKKKTKEWEQKACTACSPKFH